MAYPVIPDTFRCALLWDNAAGQRAVNVMHILDLSGSATPTDIYNQLNGAVATGMWTCIQNSMVVRNVAITPLGTSGATQVFATGAPSKWSGQAASSDAIVAVCCLVSLRTAFRGQANRGRLYLPWVAESQQNTGIMLAASVTTMQTAWNTFRSTLATASPLVVASYKNATVNLVTSLLVESPCATQRRRQGRIRA